MKRIFCLLLTFFIISNSLFVICYADDESFVTKAVEAVKEKIDIPANYTEFNSKLTVEPGVHYAYFTWYGDDDENNSGGQINVTVDDKLRIVSFSQYFYGEFTGNYKISAYTSDDAKNEAMSFLEKACPEFYPYTKPVEQEYSIHRNFDPYNLKFVRYENELPCYDNYIDITVDAVSGKVSSFEVEWIDYDKVYPAKTSLSPIDAGIKFYDKIGMVKEYAKNADGTLYVRYADLSDGVKYINGYTGNIVDTNYVSEAGVYKNALTAEKDFDFWYCDTEFETDNILNIVENNSYIPLGQDYVLTGIQYLQDSYSTYLYMYYDNFNGNTKTYIVDAVNGDIRYYDFYKLKVGEINRNYSVKQCEDFAEAFVSNYEKSFISNCRLLNYNNTKNYNSEDVCYFNYTRFINDIAYDQNGVVVGVSRSTGEVVSVRSGWDAVNIPDYSLSISKDEAFEKYINAIEFELQYVTSKSMTQQMELRAVYAPNPMYDIYVDALTGELIDGDGNVADNEKTVYTDISKDVAEEQIKVLVACGILDEAEKFYPQDNVLLCDYLLWMCRAIDCVDYESIADVYAKLIESGIVTYEEIMNNQPVNTETGIKYIVSYLGYDEIATLTDTFKTDFVDEGSISPGLIGYAAIAKGLKIFKGNAFMPKDYIKRNVAAQIFYNLISN